VLEAHYTTHIEGTHLTLDQSGKLLAGEQLTGVDPDDARELLNYRDAFDLVSDYLGSGEPVTEGLIREIHKRLVRGVRGDAAAPGEYRRVQNYIVEFSDPGSNLYAAGVLSGAAANAGARTSGSDGWLEYFTGGLATQLSELQARGEGVIRRDVVALRHGLTARQKKAVELAGEKGTFGIRDYEEASPWGNEADAAAGVEGVGGKGVLRVEGATRNLSYSLGEGF
jgi:hypothetical protein